MSGKPSAFQCTTPGCDRLCYARTLCKRCYEHGRKVGVLPDKVWRTRVYQPPEIEYSPHSVEKYGAPYRQRFWKNVDLSGDCWEWTGSANIRTQYGRATAYPKTKGSRQSELAHRMAWEMLVGAIPAHLEIDHRCYNRRCVNPDHLEPVTAQVNAARVRVNKNRIKRTCPRGHALDQVYKDGRRGCKTCNAAHARAAAERQKKRSIPCSVGGCDAPTTTRGWCDKHYTRWKRHGDPTRVFKTGPRKRDAA